MLTCVTMHQLQKPVVINMLKKFFFLYVRSIADHSRALDFCISWHDAFLTLKAQIAKKVVWFCRLLKCFSSFLTNSMDPDQTAPVGAA